jgi:hypothetical protein
MDPRSTNDGMDNNNNNNHHDNYSSWLDHDATASSASSTRAGSRKSRVYLFQEFVWKVYGTYLQGQQQQQLQQQQRNPVGENNNNNTNRIDEILVLDVAGGKGDLSWLLTHVHGIPSIVVDPQAFPSTNVMDNHSSNNNDDDDTTINSTKVSSSSSSLDHDNCYHPHPIEKSVYYLLQHPDEAQRRSIPGLPTYQPLAALLPQIQQLRQQLQRKGPQRMSPPSTQDQPSHNDGASSSSSLVGPLPPPTLQPIFTLPIYMNDALVHAIGCQVQGTTTISNNNNHHTPQPNEGDMNQIATTTTTTKQHDWNTYWQSAWYHQHAKPTVTARSKRKRLRSSTFSSSPSPSHHDSFSTERATDDSNKQEPPPPLDALAALRLFSSSIKLIVGFHPDQATEACMDLAVLLNIPFCVVPCCVFPNEFPNRNIPVAMSTITNTNASSAARSETMSIPSRQGSIHQLEEEGEDKSRNGMDPDEPFEEQTTTSSSATTRVRTYSQFLTYLKQKYQPHKVQTAELNFDFTETAKNIVLYTLPPSS